MGISMISAAAIMVLPRKSNYKEPLGPRHGGARAFVTLRVSIPCSGAGDPVCDDGTPCSLDICKQEDGQWRCDRGVPGYYGECCTSKYQCAPGQACVSNKCQG